MLTVCIDSNVYISAIAFGGKPLKVIEYALARRFYLIISSAIITEVKHNLVKKLEFSSTEVDQLFNEIITVSTIYEPTGLHNFINHQKDNLVLETALLGDVDILVTGDKKDLLPLKVFHNIIIEPPSAFLMRLESIEYDA
jgi:uncharacterized protein